MKFFQSLLNIGVLKLVLTSCQNDTDSSSMAQSLFRSLTRADNSKFVTDSKPHNKADSLNFYPKAEIFAEQRQFSTYPLKNCKERLEGKHYNTHFWSGLVDRYADVRKTRYLHYEVSGQVLIISYYHKLQSNNNFFTEQSISLDRAKTKRNENDRYIWNASLSENWLDFSNLESHPSDKGEEKVQGINTFGSFGYRFLDRDVIEIKNLEGLSVEDSDNPPVLSPYNIDGFKIYFPTDFVKYYANHPSYVYHFKLILKKPMPGWNILEIPEKSRLSQPIQVFKKNLTTKEFESFTDFQQDERAIFLTEFHEGDIYKVSYHIALNTESLSFVIPPGLPVEKISLLNSNGKKCETLVSKSINGNQSENKGVLSNYSIEIPKSCEIGVKGWITYDYIPENFSYSACNTQGKQTGSLPQNNFAFEGVIRQVSFGKNDTIVSESVGYTKGIDLKISVKPSETDKYCFVRMNPENLISEKNFKSEPLKITTCHLSQISR